MDQPPETETNPRETITKVARLLKASMDEKKDMTVAQVLTVFYAIETGGLTQKSLSEKLGITEGAVSRNVQKLGPDGTGCLLIKNGKVIADPHVTTEILELLR